MDPVLLGILGIVALILCMATGMPICIAMFTVGGLGMVYVNGLPGLYAQAQITAFNWSYNFTIAVVPLFILMGYIFAESGAAEDMFRAARMWLGRIPGGLGMATCLAAAGFGACSASAFAAIILFNRIALPEMLKAGYSKRLATGLITVAGTLAALIPPSIFIIFVGMLTGESIGKLLLAAFIPGFLAAFLYAMVTWGLCTIGKWGPASRESFTWKQKFVSLKGIWGIVFIMAVIIGGIYGGVFSPTEAGALGCFGALVVSLINRKMTFKAFRDGTMSAASAIGMVFALLIGAILFSRFLTVCGFVQALGVWLLGMGLSGLGVMLIFMLMYFILGLFMDAGAMIIMTVPFVYPTLIGFGFNGTLIGILMVMMCLIAVVTPPMALCLYMAQQTAQQVDPSITLSDVIIGTVPYLVTEIGLVILLIFVPQIALFLPNTMMGQ